MSSVVQDESLPSTWRERLLARRNRLIGDPRFQRWAAASPFTRFIARRRAKALFDLCAGFVYSQVLLACVRLRVFDSLAQGPRDVEGLARSFGLQAEPTLRLLRAAASLRLLREMPDGRFALDDLGASMIGNPSIADFVEHHTLLYDDLRDPVALLRGDAATELSRFWPYAATGASSAQSEAYARYSRLMSRTQALVAEDILDAWPMNRHRCLLDVGGGEGTFIRAVAQRCRDLRLQMFDLPPVAERARDSLAAHGLQRVTVTGGSFLENALPSGADVVSLVRIVHDHDDASVKILLRAVHAALPPGGTLLIAEQMAGTRGAESMGDAYFGFYLMAMGGGRPRRADELTALLTACGFTGVRSVATRRPLLTSLIVARRA